jgi:hypothetical protein
MQKFPVDAFRCRIERSSLELPDGVITYREK